jgi:hypothetical protein
MATDDPRIVRQVAERLGNYVYVLVDPRDSMPFYIGKGIGARMLQHGIDAAHLSAPEDEESADASRKITCIRSIRFAGFEPVVWVLRYGLSTKYTAVKLRRSTYSCRSRSRQLQHPKPYVFPSPSLAS